MSSKSLLQAQEFGAYIRQAGRSWAVSTLYLGSDQHLPVVIVMNCRGAILLDDVAPRPKTEAEKAAAAFNEAMGITADRAKLIRASALVAEEFADSETAQEALARAKATPKPVRESLWPLDLSWATEESERHGATHFDVVPCRIVGSRHDGSTSVEKCLPEEAEFWGAYVIGSEGLPYWILDATTKRMAESACDKIRQTLNLDAPAPDIAQSFGF